MLPSPPFVLAPGLANLRDAGGYAIASQAGEPGRAVRRGVLFRSADLSQVTDAAIATLRQLGIKRVFDLRSSVEIGHASADNKSVETPGQLPLDWHDAERVFVPVFLDFDYSPEAIATRFGNYSSGTHVSHPVPSPSQRPSRMTLLLSPPTLSILPPTSHQGGLDPV